MAKKKKAKKTKSPPKPDKSAQLSDEEQSNQTRLAEAAIKKAMRITLILGTEGTLEPPNIMACSLFVTSSRNEREHYHCSLFVVLCAYL